MTDKKDAPQKSVESGSSDPAEPIERSELTKPRPEDDDDEDIIILKDEVKIAPKTEESQLKSDEEASFEIEEDEDLFSLTDEFAVESEEDEDFPRFEELTLEEEDDEDLFSLTDETSTELQEEEEEEILRPLDESVLDFEGDDTTATLTDNTGIGADDDEIIEITEFDEHFPAEKDKEILDFQDSADHAISEDEEFLELIDVDDEDLLENADTIEFDTAEEKMEDAEIENFFSEPFEEEIELDQNGKDNLADSLGMDLESVIEMTDDLDQDEKTDFATGAAALSAAKAEIGKNLVDDPNRDVNVAAQHKEKPEPAEFRPEASQLAAEIADLGTISSRQIEDALERLINQNYSEKIESIILQVIEKTVSKEIEKLKELLLEGASTDEMK